MIFTTENMIALSAFFIIATLLHYKIPGSFVFGLLFGSISYWLFTSTFPTQIVSEVSINNFSLPIETAIYDTNVWILVLDLFIISICLLSSLTRGLSPLMEIDTEHGPPRKRWIYFSAGVGTMATAGIGAGPLLLSVESAPGLMTGARTGI